MKKKLVIGLVLGVISISSVGCGNVQNVKTNAHEQQQSTSTNKLSKEQIIQGIKENFANSNFKYNDVSYDDKSNTLHVKLAIEGLTESLSSTKYYDIAKGKESWETIKNSYNELCTRIRNQFKENGHNDVDVFLFLVNELNTDKALFSSLNGVEYSDYMK